MKLKKKKD